MDDTQSQHDGRVVAATEPRWTVGARAQISRPQGVEQDVVEFPQYGRRPRRA
jgi:hypothetical protein